MRVPRASRVAAISLLTAAATFTASPARADVSDGSFEAQNLGAGYFYNPAGFPWTFSSTSGVIQPPSAFNGPNPAPDGSQYAFLQTNRGDSHFKGSTDGLISQAITLPDGGVYQIGLQHASREGPPVATYQILLDGSPIGGTQGAPQTSFKPSGFTFNAAPGPHTLAFA